MTRWQQRVHAIVSGALRRDDQRFGRAYASFLSEQAQRLDKAFGLSRARAGTPHEQRRNPYRISARLLKSLGYSTYDIAEVLHLTQSAVARLLREPK